MPLSCVQQEPTLQSIHRTETAPTAQSTTTAPETEPGLSVQLATTVQLAPSPRSPSPTTTKLEQVTCRLPVPLENTLLELEALARPAQLSPAATCQLDLRLRARSGTIQTQETSSVCYAQLGTTAGLALSPRTPWPVPQLPTPISETETVRPAPPPTPARPLTPQSDWIARPPWACTTTRRTRTTALSAQLAPTVPAVRSPPLRAMQESSRFPGRMLVWSAL